MISEVNYSTTDNIHFDNTETPSVDQIDSKVVRAAKETARSSDTTTVAALDPKRINNAISYLIGKVEEIQLIEKLYYAHIRHKDADMKATLTEIVERPESYTSLWVISYAFETVLRERNIEFMNFMCDTLGERLSLDPDTAVGAMQVYIKHGCEDRAIWILENTFEFSDEISDMYTYELQELIEDANQQEMQTLATKLNSIRTLHQQEKDL